MFISPHKNVPTDFVDKSLEFRELIDYVESKNVDSIEFGNNFLLPMGGILVNDLGEYSVAKWINSQLSDNNYCVDKLPNILMVSIKVFNELCNNNNGWCYTLESIIRTYKYWHHTCIKYYNALPKEISTYDIFVYHFTLLNTKKNTLLKKLIYVLYKQYIIKNKNNFLFSTQYLKIYQKIKSLSVFSRYNGARVKSIDISKYAIAKWLSHSISNKKSSLTWNNPQIPFFLRAVGKVNELVESNKTSLIKNVNCVNSVIKTYDSAWIECNNYLLHFQNNNDNSTPKIIYFMGFFVSALSVHINEIYTKWEHVMKNNNKSQDIELEIFLKD